MEKTENQRVVVESRRPCLLWLSRVARPSTRTASQATRSSGHSRAHLSRSRLTHHGNIFRSPSVSPISAAAHLGRLLNLQRRLSLAVCVFRESQTSGWYVFSCNGSLKRLPFLSPYRLQLSPRRRSPSPSPSMPSLGPCGPIADICPKVSTRIPSRGSAASVPASERVRTSPATL